MSMTCLTTAKGWKCFWLAYVELEAKLWYILQSLRPTVTTSVFGLLPFTSSFDSRFDLCQRLSQIAISTSTVAYRLHANSEFPTFAWHRNDGICNVCVFLEILTHVIGILNFKLDMLSYSFVWESVEMCHSISLDSGISCAFIVW